MNACPRCRALFPADQKACPHCGTSIVPRQLRERGGIFDRLSGGRIVVVPAILIANVALYAGMLVFQGGAAGSLGAVSSRTVAQFGGLYGPLVLEHGDFYRLLCPIFLHFGLLHLAFNGMVIWFLGTLAEKIYGPAKFLAFCVATGVLALVASLLFRGQGPGVAAGASGAGFGLFGLVGVFAFRRGLEEIKRTVIFWTLISLVYGFSSSNIDNAAHLGGLAAGILFGLRLRDAAFTRLRPGTVRIWDGLAVLTVLAVLLSFGFALVDGGVVRLG